MVEIATVLKCYLNSISFHSFQ